MLGRKSLAAYAVLLAVCVAGVQAGQDSFSAFWGSKYQPAPPGPRSEAIRAQSAASDRESGDPMHHWNRVAVDSAGLDHTPVAAGESRVFGEQLGPGRSSRAMAIVHIAMFDAVNFIAHRYTSFTGINDVRETASMPAAIARRRTTRSSSSTPRNGSTATNCSRRRFRRSRTAPTKLKASSPASAPPGKSAADRERRFTACRAGRRRRLYSWQPAWRMAARPDQRSPRRARRALGSVGRSSSSRLSRFARRRRPSRLCRYAAAFNEVKRLGGDVTPRLPSAATTRP